MSLFMLLSLHLFGIIRSILATAESCADGEERVIRIPQSPKDTTAIPAKDFSEVFDTYEDMSGAPSSLNVCEQDVPKTPNLKQNLLNSVPELLEEFYQDLRSFIDSVYFNTRGFEQQGPRLEERLIQIKNQVESIGDGEAGEKITEMLEFVSHTFSKMGGAIESLKHFKSPGPPGHNLIWTVLEMNVRLFAFQDSSGRADSEIPDFLDRAHSHLQTLTFLENQIKAFPSIAFGAKMVFKNEFAIADCTLACLTLDILRVTSRPARVRCFKKCAFPKYSRRRSFSAV